MQGGTGDVCCGRAVQAGPRPQSLLADLLDLPLQGQQPFFFITFIVLVDASSQAIGVEWMVTMPRGPWHGLSG